MLTLLRKQEVEQEKELLLLELERLSTVEKKLSDPSQVQEMDLVDFLPKSKIKKRVLRVFGQSTVNIKTVGDLINHEYNILRYYGIDKGVIAHLTGLLRPYGLLLKYS